VWCAAMMAVMVQTTEAVMTSSMTATMVGFVGVEKGRRWVDGCWWLILGIGRMVRSCSVNKAWGCWVYGAEGWFG
jgi:hypothetical protein